MPKSNANLALKGLDEMFSTEESRQEQKREQVQQIPIEELFPFKEHPFKVLDDEAMQRTVESVAQYGVLAPLIARPRPEGGYEIDLRPPPSARSRACRAGHAARYRPGNDGRCRCFAYGGFQFAA